VLNTPTSNHELDSGEPTAHPVRRRRRRRRRMRGLEND